MVIVGVGSKNPTKVGAVNKTFPSQLFQVEGRNVDSGVSSQPLSSEETKQGAWQRAKALAAEGYEVGIGLEGGITKEKDGWYLCNWGALVTKDGFTCFSGGTSIRLPNEIIEPLLEGKELAEVMDEFTKRKDIRSHEGAVGIFTNGTVVREELFLHIAKLLYGQYQYFLQNNK